MAIRYDKKLNNEINRVIRNYNQKVYRLKKLDKELIPNIVNKKQITQNVRTRKELYSKLKQLQRFSKRNVEQVIETAGGVKLTQYELLELKRDVKNIKRRITNELKYLEIKKPSILGKEQTSTYAQMGDRRYLNLKAKRKALNKNITLLNKAEFKRFKEFVDKNRKSDYSSENQRDYIEVYKRLGYYFGYDDNKMDNVINKLMNLSQENLFKLFRDEKTFKAIIEYYYTIGQIFTLGLNYEDLQNDVFTLYDSIYENIDKILIDYA